MTSPWQFDQTPASATPDPSGGPGLPGHPGADAADDVPGSWWDAARGDVVAGAIVLGVCLLVGAAAGAVWYAVAPEIPKVVVDHTEFLRPSAGTESEVAR